LTWRKILRSGLLVLAAGLFVVAEAQAYTVRVLATAVSPNGRWRIELADHAVETRFELWATPAKGGQRLKIGGPVPFDHDVSEFVISGDSARVAYRQGRTATGEWLLYSTPISGQVATRICQWMPLGGAVDRGITLVMNGSQVRFRADPVLDEQFSWFIVPVSGGAIYGELFSDGFASGSPEAWH
jgi:hypothetical protein